jgi:hypothetical protein
MTTGVYIAVVEIDSSCEYKIRNKHGITGDEVREAIILTPVSAYWEDSAVHGLRLLVTGSTRDRREVFAVLQPLDPTDGAWALRTARWI